MNRTLGLIFTVAGAVMLLLSLFTYTKRKKLIDAGPLQVSVEERQQTNWLPYAGGLFFIGGVSLILISRPAR